MLTREFELLQSWPWKSHHIGPSSSLCIVRCVHVSSVLATQPIPEPNQSIHEPRLHPVFIKSDKFYSEDAELQAIFIRNRGADHFQDIEESSNSRWRNDGFDGPVSTPRMPGCEQGPQWRSLAPRSVVGSGSSVLTGPGTQYMVSGFCMPGGGAVTVMIDWAVRQGGGWGKPDSR